MGSPLSGQARQSRPDFGPNPSTPLTLIESFRVLGCFTGVRIQAAESARPPPPYFSNPTMALPFEEEKNSFNRWYHTYLYYLSQLYTFDN